MSERIQVVDATSPEPSAVAIVNAEGELVVRANYDGTVEFGEGIEPDEAARIFWREVAAIAPARQGP